MRSTILALLAALATSAHAVQTLSFEPANPTPADRIVVTFRDTVPGCLTFDATSTRFVSPNEIRLAYSQTPGCGASEAKMTLGPLPAGIYTVALGVHFDGIPPPPHLSQQLTVSLPRLAGAPNAAGPLENYAGHYLTGPASGEGVFIEQFGDKSFLTYATYDSQGRPTWIVMPDARWTFNAARGRSEFAGAVYRTQRGEESPPSIRVTSIGTGAWYPSGFDTVTLETTTEGTERRFTLRRFRF